MFSLFIQNKVLPQLNMPISKGGVKVNEKIDFITEQSNAFFVKALKGLLKAVVSEKK